MSAVKHQRTDSKNNFNVVFAHTHTHTKIMKGKFSVAGSSTSLMDGSFSNYLVCSCLG